MSIHLHRIVHSRMDIDSRAQVRQGLYYDFSSLRLSARAGAPSDSARFSEREAATGYLCIGFGSSVRRHPSIIMRRNGFEAGSGAKATSKEAPLFLRNLARACPEGLTMLPCSPDSRSRKPKDSPALATRLFG